MRGVSSSIGRASYVKPFTMWNPADALNMTFSDGNKTATPTTGGGVRSLLSIGDGRLYFEASATNSNFNSRIGIGDLSTVLASGQLSNIAAINPLDGRYSGGGTEVATSFTGLVGSTIMFAVDTLLTKIWFGKDGTWEVGDDPTTGAGGRVYSVTGPLYKIVCNGGTGRTYTLINPTVYSPPNGFERV